MLTPQVQNFVKEYISSRNEEQSAIAVGIASEFAKKMAETWLKNPEVLEFMTKEVRKSPDEKIDRQWLLNEAKNTYINASKATDKATCIRLMHDIVSAQAKEGADESAQPTINIYTEKDINIL